MPAFGGHCTTHQKDPHAAMVLVALVLISCLMPLYLFTPIVSVSNREQPPQPTGAATSLVWAELLEDTNCYCLRHFYMSILFLVRPTYTA